MDNFISFLNKSENLRKGYINSLEKADVNFKKKWLKCFSYILDSRINMTRLVPQLRVLHKSQPA